MFDSEVNRVGTEGGTGPSRRPQVTQAAVGLAGGLAVNSFSNDFGWRASAIVAAIAAILLATNWFRGLPPRAPLVAVASWTTLTIAGVATVLAVALPVRWQGHAVMAASLLAIAAVLLRADPDEALDTLGGVAFIGLGVALIGFGVSLLADSKTLGGVAFIGLGLALIGIGVSLLAHSKTLGGLALIGVGAALIGIGIALLASGYTIAGIASVGSGVAGVGVGISELADSNTLGGVAIIGSGVALIGFGVSRMGSLLAWMRQLTQDPDDSPQIPGLGTEVNDRLED